MLVFFVMVWSIYAGNRVAEADIIEHNKRKAFVLAVMWLCIYAATMLFNFS